jgi:hypothetical protein
MLGGTGIALAIAVHFEAFFQAQFLKTTLFVGTSGPLKTPCRIFISDPTGIFVSNRFLH